MACHQDSFVNFACRVHLFQQLSVEELNLLRQRFRLVSFNTNDVIVREHSERDDNFYLICGGRVKVVTFNIEGDEQIFTTLDRGTFFGEMSLIENKPRSASVIAMTPCQLYILSKEGFFHMLAEFPSVSVALMRDLCSRIRLSNQQMNNLTFMSVRGRLLQYLGEILKKTATSPVDGGVEISLPTQKDIGAHIGATRESVSRALVELQNEGVILKTGRKKVVVKNGKALQV